MSHLTTTNGGAGAILPYINERGFPPRVVEILRDADRQIRSLPPDDSYLRYDFLRATMGKIAPVDSFYVGFYRGGSLIAFPYTYDQDELEAPGVLTYGPNGLGAWLLRHQRTYTYRQDQGRLLGAGHRFGDTSRISRDAVTVPLVDDGGGDNGGGRRVLGMVSMLSYTPHVYDDDAVRALEWLCRTLVALLRREREDVENLRDLDADQPVAGASLLDVVVGLTNRLDAVRTALREVRAAALAGQDVLDQVEDLDRLCARVQQETFAVLVSPSSDALEPLSQLTAREREIADLIGYRMSNQQIARALTISLATVKTHVYNIMRKFQVRQRAEIAAMLRPFD